MNRNSSTALLPVRLSSELTPAQQEFARVLGRLLAKRWIKEQQQSKNRTASRKHKPLKNEDATEG